jgi:hypothetical protein
MARTGFQAIRDGMRHNRRLQSFALLFLAAFAFHVAILRAHIHTGAATGASIDLADQAPATGGKPVKHSEADCPLWHASATCGTGLIPTAAALVLPPKLSAEAPRDERNILLERFAAAWRSRAPPTL